MKSYGTKLARSVVFLRRLCKPCDIFSFFFQTTCADFRTEGVLFNWNQTHAECMQHSSVIEFGCHLRCCSHVLIKKCTLHVGTYSTPILPTVRTHYRSQHFSNRLSEDRMWFRSPLHDSHSLTIHNTTLMLSRSSRSRGPYN